MASSVQLLMESCKNKGKNKGNLGGKNCKMKRQSKAERMKHEALACHQLAYSGLLGLIILTWYLTKHIGLYIMITEPDQ
ncbi:hypothetical protein TSUD_240200 [Trifolium subterraneum]|uniref:Uncharacterized protein n=1 Tax=Trifolium subterraneum TaxID=3900 RepID=A0A2Z6LT61_TRISU|nr:hypothetical protein TSUD_240200 [Trifolium subterraneum]